MRIIGLIVLIFILIKAAALLFAPFMLAFMAAKKALCHMDEKKWMEYLGRLTHAGFAVRFFLIYLVPMVIVSALGYLLFALFGYENPLGLAALTFAVGMLLSLWQIFRHKQELITQLGRIQAGQAPEEEDAPTAKKGRRK